MESGNLFLSNDDLLLEVLIRLPLKSVLRFKCVSPQWRDLISSRHFFRCYAAAHRDGTGRLLAFFQEVGRNPQECNNFPICKEFIGENIIPRHVGRFINSSNGLILCSRILDLQITYHVGNPLTGKFVELPPPPADNFYAKMGRKLISSVLVCEEDNNNEAPAYSVVRAGKMSSYRTPDDHKCLYIDSYSSKTGKWSSVTLFVLPQIFYLLRCLPAVVANGLVHWYTVNKHILVYNHKGGDPKLQCIRVPDGKTRCVVTRTSDDVLWLGLKCNRNLRFYILPKHCTSRDEVDANEWVLMHEVSFKTLSTKLNKGLVASKYEEAKLDCLIPESRSEVVAVLRQRAKVFLYNVQRESLVKMDYLGRFNKVHPLCPYLQSSSLSSYCF